MKKSFLTPLYLILPLLALNVSATVIYWDPEGTATQTAANLTGTWDTTSSFWTSANTQSSTLTTWVTSDAACFCAQTGTAATGAFTVTVNSTISCAGVYNGNLTPAGYNLTLAGTGALSFNSGVQAFGCSGSDGDPLIMNIPITGPGGLAYEVGDQVYMNVSNSYTGGSVFGYIGSGNMSGIINFTNGTFGSGGIYLFDCPGGAMVVLGQNAVTIPNGVTNRATNVSTGPTSLSLNIVGNPAGVTFTGPWNLTGGSGPNPTPAVSTNSQLYLGSGGGVTNLVTIAGVISGTNGFAKYGVGMLQLTGANTYGHAGTTLGSTTISNGWLILANTSGSATGVSSIIVTNSGSTGTGTLTGSGSASGAVTINSANISATNMTGGTAALTTGAETWLPGTTNIFAINNVAGTAGASSGWDEIVINGALTINSIWTLNVTSLTAANKQGALASFNNATNYTWPILTASGGISGFNANNVTIKTTAFANSLGGGEFALSTNGNTIYLNFLQQPTVAISPSALTVMSNGTAIIQAAVTGGELTYQWQLNGGSLTAGASGQSTATLTISPVQDADAGTYTLTVANPANPGGVSASLLLTVINPPQFQGPNSFNMSFSGPVGQSYRIWSTTDITLPVLSGWNIVSAGQQFAPGVNTFTDTAASFTAEYYCITVP